MRSTALKPSLAGTPIGLDLPSGATQFANLIDAALSGDHDQVRRLAAMFAQEYKGEDQKEIVSRIRSLMRRRTASLDGMRDIERLPVDRKTRTPLAEEMNWPTTPLILEDAQSEILDRFVTESQNADKLIQAGLGSRFNLLLSGLPGTGKTFIAGHIAARLGRPFHVVRLDSIMSSLLGDTAKNIRALFEYANIGAGFIFIDEVDAVAKKRDDDRELGEIKRVVNTLIQALDMLDERTVVVAATNHAHLLDPAIFRRFPYHLEVPLPGDEMRQALWNLYLFQDHARPESQPLSVISRGLSCSDIRELSLAARRTALINQRDIDVGALAVAIITSEMGKLRLPSTSELDNRSKRELFDRLGSMELLNYKQIGLLTGVTRQAATTMAKRQRERKTI